MTIVYADTSAIVRAYVVDEPDHAELRDLIRGGREVVVTSELAGVELASALHAAGRSGRLRRPETVLARFDADCQADGPIALLRLQPDRILPEARRLVASQALRTLDGIHLATALINGREIAAGADLVFLTRDERQAMAAESEGLAVAEVSVKTPTRGVVD